MYQTSLVSPVNIFNTMWIQYVTGLRGPVTRLRLSLRGYIFGFSDDSTSTLQYVLKDSNRHVYSQDIL